MKTAIVYYSRHHENTKRLVEAIKKASPDEVTLIDVTRTSFASLAEHDRIGFASGIYYSKFEKRVLAFAKNLLPNGKKYSSSTHMGQKRTATPEQFEKRWRAKTQRFSANTAAWDSTHLGRFS